MSTHPIPHEDESFFQRGAALVVLTMEQQRAVQAQFNAQEALEWLERVAPKEAPPAHRAPDLTTTQ